VIKESTGNVAAVRAHPDASASATVTLVSGTLPVFVTVIVQAAVFPLGTLCSLGLFVIAIAAMLGVTGGFGGLGVTGGFGGLGPEGGGAVGTVEVSLLDGVWSESPVATLV
jgi:hypothetical protein